MKFISPGGWFSLEYPATWSEFEDSEGTFLCYNPNKWGGNFRISIYRVAPADVGKQPTKWELKTNPTLLLVQVGPWNGAYCAVTFQEEGAWYTSHFWVTGKGNLSYECSFSLPTAAVRTPTQKTRALLL